MSEIDSTLKISVKVVYNLRSLIGSFFNTINQMPSVFGELKDIIVRAYKTDPSGQ